MTTDLRKQAINAATKLEWAQAVDLNLAYLDENPKDFDTCNRLGYAYLQLGKLDKAARAYQKTLALDPYNNIAGKSLEKIKLLKTGVVITNNQSTTPIKTSFLEEPGKTKTVTLVRPADTKILASLNIGTSLLLVPKKFRVNVETSSATYIGSLPDDVTYKLVRFLKHGYKYDCLVKSVTPKSVSIFIKELLRPKKYLQVPSFPATGPSKVPFSIITSQSLIDVPLDVTPTGEDDE